MFLSRKGLPRIGLESMNLFLKLGLALAYSYLKRRSMMSEKGRRPVPPATMTTFPGTISLSLRPRPFSQLRFKVIAVLFVIEVTNS